MGDSVDDFISTHTLTWSVTKGRQGAGCGQAISTHTLTWSVTLEGEPATMQNVISTHTLTWSVTRYKIMKITGVKNFNSHAHVERDCLT